MGSQIKLWLTKEVITMVKLTHFDINQFTPFSVGFDRVFDRLVDYDSIHWWIPDSYNIRKTDDFKYIIEVTMEVSVKEK